MSILRQPFLFLSQNVSAPISGALISALYPALLKGGRVTKPQQPSRKAKQDYCNVFIEYDCKGALSNALDTQDGQDKARADLAAIFQNSNDQTFIFVKNSQLLGKWNGIPRRMRGQVHLDNAKPGRIFGFFVIALCVSALCYSALPVFKNSGFLSALLSIASSILIFLLPIVALKGVEDRIVEATEHQTELDFTFHAARIEETLDRLESTIDCRILHSATATQDSTAEMELNHAELSNFVQKMQRKISDASSDLDQVALLSPNALCAERSFRLRSRINKIKHDLESL